MGYLAIKKRAARVQPKRTPQPIQPLPKEKESEVVSWPDAEWFLANKDRFPLDPFRIDCAVFVRDPKRYFDSIESEIAQGESNPRFKTGALQSDLAKIRKIFSKELR